MNLYLFPEFISKKEIDILVRFSETPTKEDYFDVFTDILRYNKDVSVTIFPLREYILSRLLETHKKWSYLSSFTTMAYLAYDIEQIYRLAFETDWSSVCRAAGVLPFPESKEWVSAKIGTEYSRLMNSLTSSQSAEELAKGIVEFYEKYSDMDEVRYSAFRWEKGKLHGIQNLDEIEFDDLGGLSMQKTALVENTRAFLANKPANNVLLVGSSGTGKSSCVKANHNYFKNNGLKVVEILKQDLEELPNLMDCLSDKKQHYIIFIDDLSFEEADLSYIELKVALDGQLEPKSSHILIYATSNRRRLMKETWKDREGADDIHSHDTLHEKMSLSERFGIRLYFGILSQKEYFQIIEMMLEEQGLRFTEQIGVEAATWAIVNNGRSGRSARQFTNDYISRQM